MSDELGDAFQRMKITVESATRQEPNGYCFVMHSNTRGSSYNVYDYDSIRQVTARH